MKACYHHPIALREGFRTIILVFCLLLDFFLVLGDQTILGGPPFWPGPANSELDLLHKPSCLVHRGEETCVDFIPRQLVATLPEQ